MYSLSPRVTGAVLGHGLSWHFGLSHHFQAHAGRVPFILGLGHFLPRPFQLIIHCPFDSTLELLPAVKIHIVNCGLWHRAVLVGCYKLYGEVQAASFVFSVSLNRLTPNDPYLGPTAPLTSKRCILYIYSTNIGTEYFQHALYSPFFLFKMQFVS